MAKPGNPGRTQGSGDSRSHPASRPGDTPATAAPYSRQPRRGGSPGAGRCGAAAQPVQPRAPVVSYSSDLEKGGAGEDGEEGGCR